MTRNLCLSCFPCIKIQKQEYSNSNENLISLESQNQKPSQNQVAQTENDHKKCIFCHLDKNRIIYEVNIKKNITIITIISIINDFN